jgi:hypothetical protein
MKNLALCTVIVVISVGSLALACGSAPEVDLTPDPPTKSGPTGTSGGGADASPESGRDGSSGTSTSSGGPDVDDGPAAPSAFTGAPAYTAKTGGNTLQFGDHPGLGNPAKAACMSCHGPGGKGPRFFLGGTVYKDKAATTAAPQIEVRVRDAAGKAVSAYSDNLGNFYVTQNAATNAGVTFPVSVGIRNATSTELMSATITSGDCNSSTCHGGAEEFPHVP